MQGKVKLSKRQIKEDKFTVFMLKAKSEVLQNWQFYAIGIAAVVLVIVAVTYYMHAQKQQAGEAATMYARAMLDVRAGNIQVATMTLQQIIEEDNDKVITRQALFLLGNVHFSRNEFDDAIRYWESYLFEDQDSKLHRAAAQSGIAGSFENQRLYAEAAAGYVKAVEEYPDGPMAGDYHLGALRNYLELGQLEEARRHLETLEEEFSDEDSFRRAQLLFAEKGQG